MDKTFDHQKHEGNIYKLWEKNTSFTPKVDKSKKPFTIIMPPPNANDPLHIGHARFVTVEDVLIRFHRMLGDPTLWLPGADHAGIETQYVFEKRLAKEGKSRFDYPRNTLYQMIWDYVQENKGKMEKQLKILGASCDWSRNKFTLDPDIIQIVYETFKKLYDEKYVYRGERVVNYCSQCGTAFSQLEVNYLERDDPFYFIDYKTLTIATTRPETIFADVAVAVNPKDKRYSNLIGKEAIVPIINKNIPIISSNLVDLEFGTGALKVTPGHDPTDFEIGQENNLKIISVINKKGKMINTPKKYLGLDVRSARKLVIKDLEGSEKIKKTEKIHHTVGTCYRDKSFIEPLISKQWFIKTKSFSENALRLIKEDKVKIVSPRYKKISINWLKSLKDWNISRQIVWGIRIPAWKCESCNNWTITDGSVPKSCKMCKSKNIVQDEDTFDTWFSSGQWPFVTLKTGKKGDFDYFYPTSVMETAYDILIFWVLRMIMLGVYVTDKIPFEKVVIHGLVRDSAGKKISKSKGNAIDPIEMVNKYGADALRMGIIWGALVENDISLSEANIKAQRNFANKVWNVSRFIYLSNNQTKINVSKPINVSEKEDVQILKDLDNVSKSITQLLNNSRFNQAAEEIYNFIWKKFADQYLEKTKSRKQNALPTLNYVLQQVLILTHPFMPFVTEAIYQKMFSKTSKDLLIDKSWPK